MENCTLEVRSATRGCTLIMERNGNETERKSSRVAEKWAPNTDNGSSLLATRPSSSSGNELYRFIGKRIPAVPASFPSQFRRELVSRLTCRSLSTGHDPLIDRATANQSVIPSDCKKNLRQRVTL